ncbi:MAG: hypothetical protein NT141_00885 [candidate division WWE3 bacterium]|nr:hypothetical protein [candidate division WWE3 bacterium]
MFGKLFRFVRGLLILVVILAIAVPSAVESLSPPPVVVPILYKLNNFAGTALTIIFKAILDPSVPVSTGKIATQAGQTIKSATPGTRSFVDGVVAAWPVFLVLFFLAILVWIIVSKNGRASAMKTVKGTYTAASSNIKGLVWVVCAGVGTFLVFLAFSSQAGYNFNQPVRGLMALIPSGVVALVTYIIFRSSGTSRFFKLISTVLGCGILVAIFMVGNNQSPASIKASLTRSVPAPVVTDVGSSAAATVRYAIVDAPGIIASVVSIFGYSEGLSLAAIGCLFLIGALLVKHLIPDNNQATPFDSSQPQR